MNTRSIARYEAVLKVTGQARYEGEILPEKRSLCWVCTLGETKAVKIIHGLSGDLDKKKHFIFIESYYCFGTISKLLPKTVDCSE